MEKAGTLSSRSSKHGTILRLEGLWCDRFTTYAHRYNIVGIEVLPARAGSQTCLSFLTDLPPLKYFSSRLLRPFDSGPLYRPADLECIQIQASRELRIDFGRFPNLRAASFPWQEQLSSIFSSVRLRRLSLLDYMETRSTSLTCLKDLEALCIKNSSLAEVNALKTMSRIRKLELGLLPRLSALDPLGHCTYLEVLRLARCGRAEPFGQVAGLGELRYLFLHTGKRVISLEFLKDLKKLRLFNFDCAVENGDLSVLERLPSLGECVFLNRRRYSVGCQDLRERLARTHGALSAAPFCVPSSGGRETLPTP